jgi:hypothetical protein
VSDRVTKRQVEEMFARFCRAFIAAGGVPDDLRLEHNSVYGYVVTNAQRSSHPFGMHFRTAREMNDVLDFAIDVLHLAYRHGRARYDVVGYPPEPGVKFVEHEDVGFHDALHLCEKLEAAKGYSHHMIERDA